MKKYLSIDEALCQLSRGRMILVSDDENRENEADLILPAQFATPEAINFIIHAHGLVCVALPGERLDALQIPMPQRRGGSSSHQCNFAVSVDAVYGVTSGISAQDRSVTIRTLVDPATCPDDLAYPGHVSLLRAKPGGVLERRGHTETSVDLMRLAGLRPGAVLCEVINEQGEMMRGQDLFDFADHWELGIITVDAVACARQQEAAKSDVTVSRS